MLLEMWGLVTEVKLWIFKFSPCSKSCISSFGYFPSVRLSFGDVSEPSVRSFFKGLMKNMKGEKENEVKFYKRLTSLFR
jgi:hypothetical protein